MVMKAVVKGDATGIGLNHETQKMRDVDDDGRRNLASMKLGQDRQLPLPTAATMNDTGNTDNRRILEVDLIEMTRENVGDDKLRSQLR